MKYLDLVEAERGARFKRGLITVEVGSRVILCATDF